MIDNQFEGVRRPGSDQRVRLIASDLDGTLLGTDKQLAPRTIAAVQAAHAAGIKVMAATGRSTRSAIPRIIPAGVIDTVVCSNGSLIHDVESATTERFAIDPAMVARLFATLEAIDERYSFCWETNEGSGWDPAFDVIASSHNDLGDRRTLERRPHPADQTTKVMVAHPEIHHDALRSHLEPLVADPLTISTSGVEFVEITGAGIDKSSALIELCRRWSIDADDVVAFGDNHNDSQMLSWAGHGVAMGNGADSALAVADEVIGTTAEDAVAMWIERLLQD